MQTLYASESENCNETKNASYAHLGSLPVFGRVRVAHLFSFLCCVFVLFVFVLCLVYPMLQVSLDCHFSFTLRLLNIKKDKLEDIKGIIRKTDNTTANRNGTID